MSTVPTMVTPSASEIRKNAASDASSFSSVERAIRPAPTAMTKPAIAADVHQPLDVHLDAFAKVALDLTLGIKQSSDLVKVVLADVLDLRVDIDARFAENVGRARFAYTVDIGHSDLSPFVGR